MKYKLYSILFVLFLLSSGAVSAQDEYQFLTHDDIERSFVMHLPADYDESQPTPLLIVLHGAGDSGINMMTNTNLASKSDEAGYIIVFPDANSGYWRYVDGSTYEGDPVVDDVAFTVALIDHLAEGYNIDQNRVFVMGFSSGGFMSLRLRCELTDRIAGVVVVGATMDNELAQICLDAEPMPSILALGNQDASIPWDGFVAIGDDSLYVQFSMAQTVQFMAGLNSCEPEPEMGGVISTLDSPVTVLITVYADCADNSTTAFLTLQDFWHAWPGEIPVVLDPTRNGNIYDVFFSFFDSHVRE
jgi:polyhydroxybutyrate depolymerase